MGEVLYQASYQFDFFCLIPVFMFIFICFFPKIVIHSYKSQDKEINIKFVNNFSLIFKVLTLVFICIMIIIELVTYKQVICAFKDGNYKTVEGYVENYKPMPYEGHSDESFTIGGIDFSYSDYEITQGYHNAASHGGVITHDGQYLKIGYVEEKNIIVYIEELSE